MIPLVPPQAEPGDDGPAPAYSEAEPPAPPSEPSFSRSNTERGDELDEDDTLMRKSTMREKSTPYQQQQYPALPTYKYEHFNKREQTLRLLRMSLLQWFVTLVLGVAIFAVLWVYGEKQALPQNQKRIFNVIMIGLTVALSLNIANSLQNHVAELRWWLLSLRKYTPREVDLILQSEHISRLMLLGWTSRHFVIHAFVLVVLSLNLASQIGLALLGLVYNVNPAETMSVTKPGIVSIPDLSDIQSVKILAKGTPETQALQALSARRYAANSFGLIGLDLGEDDYEDMPSPGTTYNPDNSLVFSSDYYPEYQYIFYDASPPDANYWNMVTTNRSVTVSSNCTAHHVVEGGNGLSANITVSLPEGNKTYVLPVVNGPDQMLYLHDPKTDGSNETWSQVRVFEASGTDPWFYMCNTSISHVTNAVFPEQKLGANLTTFVTPAIALRGYGSSSVGLVNDTTEQYQFQSYPSQSYFGSPMEGDPVGMGYTIARFGINVVASVAQSNTNINATGRVPLKSVQIDIDKWEYVYIILGLTVVLQLVLSLVAVWIANKVQVRGYSYLGTAAMLRPSLQVVSQRASRASGRQIAAMIGEQSKLQYIPEGNGRYDLALIREPEMVDEMFVVSGTTDER